MRRSKRWTDALARAGDDTGSATLEFATAGLLLLLPLVALIVVLGAIQSGAFAVQAAAAQAARIVSGGGDPASIRSSAATAISFALADYGFTSDSADAVISCEPASPWPLRGGAVAVTIDLPGPSPLAPGFLGAAPPSVTLASTATRPVSRFATCP